MISQCITFLTQRYLQKRQVNRARAAGEVVQYAQLYLTREFSRIFRCISQDFPEAQSSLAINCLTVSVYCENSSAGWKISFSEMKQVTYEK